MAEQFNANKIAQAIFDNVGGVNNVETVNHCMTRVRMTIRNDASVNVDALKKIPGVLGVVDDSQLQVIIGPGKVNKVADAMAAITGVKLGEEIPAGFDGKAAVNEKAAEMKAATKAKQKHSKMKDVLKDISDIFVPMIPAFVGAGLLAGIAAIISNLITAHTITGQAWVTITLVLNIIKSGLFTYLVIFTGVNAARVFGANQTLGGVIGAVTMLTGMDPKAPLANLFTGQALTAGQGGIIGVIFAVWLLALLEKWMHKVVPDSLDIIIVPMVCLLVIGVVEIFLIMPIAGWISDGLVGIINWVLNVGGPFSGFVLGALFLPMVMLGLHQILTPIHIQMIEKTGSTPLLPILAMAGGGQVGAALALWVRLRKDKELCEMIKGALPVGLLGVGEPLIYGVTLPLGKPFITACIGGGIGGAVVGGIGHIGAIAIGPSGLPLIPLIADNRWWGYVLGLLAAYAGGFVFTYFFGIPKDRLEAQKKMATEAAEPAATTSTNIQETNDENTVVAGVEEITAVVDGNVRDVSESSDEVFAQKAMGEGYVIEPSSSKVYAPVSGKVDSIFPTKHALIIKSDLGLSVMVHLGIDTVELKGTPFKMLVKEGDSVTASTQLVEVDWDAIKKSGKSCETMVVMPEQDHITNLENLKMGQVKAQTPIFKVTTK